MASTSVTTRKGTVERRLSLWASKWKYRRLQTYHDTEAYSCGRIQMGIMMRRRQLRSNWMDNVHTECLWCWI